VEQFQVSYLNFEKIHIVDKQLNDLCYLSLYSLILSIKTLLPLSMILLLE